jgi:PAS domain S-box-containing protein
VSDEPDQGGDPACWAHVVDSAGRQASAAHLARLVRETGDAILVCDRDGIITFWNDAASDLFGRTEGQAVGSSLDVIIPSKHRRRHWDGWHAAIARGSTKYSAELLRVPAEHADGRRLSIAFTVTLLRNPHGEVESVAAIIRDETEARQERLALEARVRELDGGESDATPSSLRT